MILFIYLAGLLVSTVLFEVMLIGMLSYVYEDNWRSAMTNKDLLIGLKYILFSWFSVIYMVGNLFIDKELRECIKEGLSKEWNR